MYSLIEAPPHHRACVTCLNFDFDQQKWRAKPCAQVFDDLAQEIPCFTHLPLAPGWWVNFRVTGNSAIECRIARVTHPIHETDNPVKFLDGQTLGAFVESLHPGNHSLTCSRW